MAKITGRGVVEKDRRQPNTWKVTHYLGEKDSKGRYKRAPRITVHGSKNDAYRALEEYRKELEGKLPIEPTDMTVGEYAKRFHELRAGTLKSPLSYDREKIDINHIDNLFGDFLLQEITVSDIKERYAKARKGKKMSESSLHKIHVKLRQVLQSAFVDEIIIRNPCELIKFTRPEPAERKSLSVVEAQRLYNLLVETERTSYAVVLLLLLATGMRRGEVLGLTWKYMKLDNNCLYVANQYAVDKKLRPPKSKESRRWVSFDEDVSKILKEWRDMQAEIFPQKDDSPVFTNEAGEFIDPNNFGRWFRNFSVDNGFGDFTEDIHYSNFKGKELKRGKGYEGLKLHELRHTQATLLISNGADWKTVQGRLGHAQASTTMNIYAHAVEANDVAAANAIGKILKS